MRVDIETDHNNVLITIWARRLAIITATLSLFFSLPQAIPAPQTERVLIITSKTTGAYGRLIQSIKKTLDKSGNRHFKLQVIDVRYTNHVLQFDSKTERPRLIVTVGTQAAKKVHDANVSIPVFNTLIPRAAYDALHKDNRHYRHTALFIDQPLIRQINLIHTALPNRRRVGIILGPYSRKIIREIDAAKGVGKVRILIKTIGNDANLIKVLNRLLEYTDVLLAVPDRTVFNRGTVHHLLLTTYRQNVPVIGYSKAYVNAGALLAVYSTPEALGIQTGEMIQMMLQPAGFQLLSPQYPKYFSVAVNRQVARSMGINLESESAIARKLRESEGKSL